MKKSVLAACIFLFLSLVLLSPEKTLAQVGSSSISGTISDTSGAAVARAKVTVRNVQTGTTTTVTSNTAGRYSAPQLGVGEYEVQAEKEGFQTTVRKGITVTVGASVVVDLMVRIGRVSEHVEVVEDAPVVDTATSAVGTLVSGRQIQDLPLNGRDLTQLACWRRAFNLSRASVRILDGVMVPLSGTQRQACEPKAKPFCSMVRTSRAFGIRVRDSLSPEHPWA